MGRITAREAVLERQHSAKISRELNLPERLPASARLLEIDAHLISLEGEVRAGTLNMEGIVRTDVYYVPEGKENEMNQHVTSFSFRESIPVGSSASSPSEIILDGEINELNFTRNSSRAFTLNLEVLTDLVLYARQGVVFPEELRSGNIRWEDLSSSASVAEAEERARIRGRKALPSSAPNIGEVISSRAEVTVLDVEVLRDLVQVAGVAEIVVVFHPAGERALRSTVLELSFQETITLNGVRPGMDCFVDVVVVDTLLRPRAAREVIIDLQLLFRPLVLRELRHKVPVPLRPEKFPAIRELQVDEVIARERTRISVVRTITIPEEKPPASRVIRATGRLIPGSLITETEEGGVFVQGEIEVDVLYVADLPTQPVFFVSGRVSFSQFINIPRVRPGMRVTIDTEIPEVRTLLIDPRRIEVRPVVRVNIVVTTVRRVDVVTVRPDVVTKPTVTPEREIIVVVRPGDTLFKIAQRYGTTVQELIRLNHIPNPNQLQVGQEIIVPQ